MYNTPEFEAMEAAGLAVAGQTAFVLVAGGLGERLGFNGIKVCVVITGITAALVPLSRHKAWTSCLQSTEIITY